MSTSASGQPRRHSGDAVSGAKPAAELIAVSPDTDIDAVGVVPVEGPTIMPLAQAPAEAGHAWAGIILEPDPTTADEIAALVLAVPDVVRLHAGRFGEVATYLPGRRVTGVKVGDGLIEIHVVVSGQVPVPQTARAIHLAVATVVATTVHVFVADIVVAA